MTAQAIPADHLPTVEHIRDLAEEAVQQIMEQAQVFASGWALVGGRFDSGQALEDAEDAKDELRRMVRALADLAAQTVRPAHAAPVAVPLIARSFAEWHFEDGPVSWWAWNGHGWAQEPAWIGTPNSNDWPGYHTHWTPHPEMPDAPSQKGGR